MTTLFRRVLVLILIGVPLRAEFLHVELTIGGLECISCAQSVDRVLKRIKGVEAASFRTKDSVAVVDLQPDNTVVLADLRDAMKGLGYTPKSAVVTAKGQARHEGGRWSLLVTGAGLDLPLDISGVSAIDGAVVVEGSIAEPAAPLKVTAMRRE